MARLKRVILSKVDFFGQISSKKEQKVFTLLFNSHARNIMRTENNFLLSTKFITAFFLINCQLSFHDFLVIA